MTVEVNSPERAALAAAIERQQVALNELDRVRRAVTRAAALVVEADIDAASFASAATEAATYRARRIKEADGDGPLVLTLPRSLTDRLSAKVAAEQAAGVARDTHAALVDDAHAAEQLLPALAGAVHEAIIAVMRQEGEALALELKKTESKAVALRKRLVALDGFRGMLPGMPRIEPMRISAATLDVLRSSPRLEGLMAEPAELDACHQYYLALARDPDASAGLAPNTSSAAA